MNKNKKDKHKNDELKNFIFRFLDNSKIQWEGNQEKEITDLNQFLDTGINLFDHPDGFCKCGNNILIIEHFEFDSSAKNKDGSKNRQEIFRVSNIKQNDTESIQIYRDKIKCDYTIENYIKNALENLNKHYLKLEEYKEHLKQEKIINDKSQVKVLFCIEDTTVLGNIDNNRKPIYLLHCKEFIETVEKMKKINYIICGSSYSSDNFTWFTAIPKIKNYAKKQYSINDRKLGNLPPHTVLGVIHIPNDCV